MLVLNYSRERTNAFLKEIDRLKESDFPHPHSKEALELVRQLVVARKVALDGLSLQNNASVIHNACAEARSQIFVYHTILGVILRSTNIRNSFEVYRPILNIGRMILGNDIKFILSSEWEYSPLVYRPNPELPKFVLMGLPASESGNPLLTPLAGHELGHTTWQTNKIENKYRPKLVNEMYQYIENNWPVFGPLFSCDKASLRADMSAYKKINIYFYFAEKQAEESFCDFLGLKIFSESYLYAFAYLLAPGSGKIRTDKYPKIKTRITNLLSAANAYSVVSPEHYEDNYKDDLDSTDDSHKLLMSAADHAVKTVVDELIQEVNDIVNASGVPARNPALILEANKFFELLVPASGAGSLANIINAGWIAYNNKNLWSDNIEIQRDKNNILYDLVLKSIEVLEYESITQSVIGGAP